MRITKYASALRQKKNLSPKKGKNISLNLNNKVRHEKKSTDIEENDLLLFEKIQPCGGITFRDETKVKTGNGYETCIHIYKYPTELTDHWMSQICNISNTISIVDISTDNVAEVKKNINRSMKEQNYRYQSARDYGDRYAAKMRFEEMQNLYDEINSMGEVIKLIDVRIYVADYTASGLEEKVKNIMTELDTNTYMPTIYLNETKREWCSMYRTYRQQQNENFAVKGQPMTSRALAGGNPFHFSDLQDDFGTYYGQTPCGGIVNLDLYAKTLQRLYYNAIVFGTMGSGKSTLLKKMFEDRAIRGDFVRAFDISGEFTELTENLGGKIIRLDGSNGILNPFEILRASDNEQMNYTMHLSKVITTYQFLNPRAEHDEITEYSNLVRGLYQSWHLVPEEAMQISGLPAANYPTFSSLLEYATKRMKEISEKEYNITEQEVAKKNILILDRISKSLQNIVYNYGYLLDGITTIDNITDEQIVTFDISALKEMSENVFDAVISNMVSLCWGNCIVNGSVMKDKWESGIIEWEDIVRFLILIDESHRWINTKKLFALEMIAVYMREARKYFGGIVLASQSIRDYVPGGKAESSDAAVNQLKTLFELTQYKFIFHQDSNAVAILREIFENVLTESQLQRIPQLAQGETILCISGDRNVEFKIYLSPEEEAVFHGGA